MTIDELCGAVDAAAMMRHLEEFARRIKLSGTPEERESFAYLQACLDGYGYRTELIEHDAYISLPGAAHLTIDNEELRCITQSFSRSSPEGVTGRIVYAGAGGESDFAAVDVRGCVALLEGIANPAASLRASRAGAIGQIHVSPHEHLHEMCISPVWGSPGTETLAQLPSTVVVSISKADGDRIKAKLSDATEVRARLQAAVDTGWRKTPLLVAELMPEREPDAPFVMFSGHHDTWHYGVMDNGSANAAMLELARLMAPARGQWKRGLRLCFWSGHSHGRYSGSAWYADTNFAELARRCVAHVNIDSVGAKGNTVLADATASSELMPLAREAVRTRGGQELLGLRMPRAGDQSFWGIGVPSLFMSMGEQPLGQSVNVAGAVLAGSRKQGAGYGWWWHTPGDLLDKMDPQLQVRDTRIYAHAIWRLMTESVPPLDYAIYLDDLRGVIEALQSELGARGGLAPVVALVRDVSACAASFNSRKSALKDDSAVAAANRTLMRVSRALVPLDYTRGDRFVHDAALSLSPYPALDPLRKLAKTRPGTDEAKFAAADATRARNRVEHALGLALEAFG